MKVFETWDVNKRIAEAKRLAERLIDHARYLLDIRENNAIVVYSDQLCALIFHNIRSASAMSAFGKGACSRPGSGKLLTLAV